MKKRKRFFIFFAGVVTLLAGIVACSKHKTEGDIPACIEKKINKLKNKEVQNPPAEVWQWKTNENTYYYYFTSDCCDQFNYLYDADCKLICAPDGGLTGQGDGKCPDFNGQTEKTIIWKDNRK